MSQNSHRDTLYSTYGDFKEVDTQQADSSSPVLRSLKYHYSSFLPEQKNAPVLDIGCGSGTFLNWLQSLGYSNTEGIDLSKEQVEAAKRHGVENVYTGDCFEKLKDTPDSSYSRIIAHDLLEHLTRPEVIELLTHIHRTLTPEGMFFLRVPNGESPFSGIYQHGDLTHETCYNRHSLKQLAGSTGFSETTILESKEHFRPEYNGSLYSLKKLILYGFHRLAQPFIKHVILYDENALISKNIIGILQK